MFAPLKYLVHEAILHGFIGRHVKVAFHIGSHHIGRLTGMQCEIIDSKLFEPENLAGLDGDIGSLPLNAAPGLMD